MGMSVDVTDYYDILGVTRDADERTIKEAFRRKARACHPDTNGGNRAAERQLSVVIEAYDVLSDRVERRRYDARICRDRMSRGGVVGVEATRSYPPAHGLSSNGPCVSRWRLYLRYEREALAYLAAGTRYALDRAGRPTVLVVLAASLLFGVFMTQWLTSLPGQGNVVPRPHAPLINGSAPAGGLRAPRLYGVCITACVRH